MKKQGRCGMMGMIIVEKRMDNKKLSVGFW